MKRTIKLPAPQLSYLKEVNIELEMTGRHYALLASCEGQLPEDVALSIIKDLTEEDATQLTLPELRYLFMLVKINSMEGNYGVDLTCIHKKKDGKQCGCVNHLDFSLADNDLNPTPSDYEPPKIKFRRDDTEKEYTVLPPKITRISALYDYFTTQKSADQDTILEDKKLSNEFSISYALLHLVDSNGEPFIKDTDNFSDILDTGLCEDGKTPKPTILNINKMSSLKQLLRDTDEVDSYGVQNKIYEFNCKECGGSIIFQAPSILYGLLD